MASKAAKSKRPDAPRGYFQRTQTLSLSLLYVLPWLIAYEVGLLVLRPEAHNAAGVVLKLLLGLLGDAHLLFNLAVIVAILIAAWRTRQHGGLEPKYLPILVLETTIWAFFMMVFAVLFTKAASESLPRVNLLATVETLGTIPEGWSPATFAIVSAFVHSAGAGVYEELVFRLFLMTGLIWGFRKLLASKDDPKRNQFAAVFLGLMLSAVLFALAHHLDPADPPTFEPMVFRTVCGAIFGVIFIVRGFAAAVYTHAIYDVFVFLLQYQRAGYFA